MGGGQGWGNIIKYQLEYVPPIQLGLLPSKILYIEKMLTKLSIYKKGYEMALSLYTIFGFLKIMAVINGLVVKF